MTKSPFNPMIVGFFMAVCVSGSAGEPAAPDLCAKAASLRKVTDGREWERLWDEILGAGEAGRDALAKEMDTPVGIASLAVEPAAPSARSGRAMSLTVTLRNDGKDGFWIRKDWIALHNLETEKWTADRAQEQALGLPANHEVSNADFAAALRREPGAPFAYVPSGGSCVVTMAVDGAFLDFVGRCRFSMGYGPPDAESARDVATPLDLHVSGLSSWIPVLPEPDAPSDGMALAFVGGLPAMAAGRLQIRLSLRNTGKEAVTIPAPTTRLQPGFWYALFDAKGAPVQAGCLDGRAGMERQYQKEQALVPGKEVEAFGSVVSNVPPGRYRLVVGFSVFPPKPPAPYAAAQMMLTGGMLGGGLRENMPVTWAGDAMTPPVEIEVTR